MTNEEWIKDFLGKENLLRGITEHFLRDDGSINSVAFTNYECSVNRGDMRNATETLNQSDKFISVCSLNYIDAAKLNQEILHDPKFDNFSHSLIKGKKSKQVKRTLAKKANIILSKE